LKWATEFLETTPVGFHSVKEAMTAAVIDQPAKPKSVESR